MAEGNWRPFAADGVPMLEFAGGEPHPFDVWVAGAPNVALRLAKDGTWHAFAYKEGSPVLWHQLPPFPEGW